MDATCKVQDNIHVFRLIHNMCPGFWVHISLTGAFDVSPYILWRNLYTYLPIAAFRYLFTASFSFSK